MKIAKLKNYCYFIKLILILHLECGRLASSLNDGPQRRYISTFKSSLDAVKSIRKSCINHAINRRFTA